MKLVFRSLRHFSLDFSKLPPTMIQSGLKNYKVEAVRTVEGYASANFTSKTPLHTVIMIHEWWGLNKSITRTAECFANNNIRVFVPDLYCGEAANSAEVRSLSYSRKLVIRWGISTGLKPLRILAMSRLISREVTAGV